MRLCGYLSPQRRRERKGKNKKTSAPFAPLRLIPKIIIMNTSKIKAYAPKARNDFIQAVTERANLYGIFDDKKIESCEIKGDVALIADRVFSKKEGELREKLVSRIRREGFQQVTEAYAYTWFNRFVALRYMEIHDYLGHGFRVLSNRGDSDIPEILENAADTDFEGLEKNKVIELRLAGNKDNELYRLLLVAQCNALHTAMPFLFDKIDSETELLLPDNLLHSDSPIRRLVNDMDEESWQEVEIIGWIYQFYISEKKDQVIGKVVKSEDIPAATQLFTPNWIVKYMVQNTLGRMWLATYPDSALREKMEYYIEPAEQEPEVQAELERITPKELNPEEITFLDPACGSGHILVEAYGVLKEIYLERGYRTKDIPKLILEKNIFGLDICDRAAQLACFAVLMKAREDDRRILGRDDLKLNVMAIQESDASDLKDIEIFFQNDGDVREGLKELVALFENAKTFGSLISVPENLVGKKELFEKAIQKNTDEIFRFGNADGVKGLLKQAEILGRKYDCVVTNPPYMGGKGMNPKIKNYLKDNYTDVKSDLFSAFIVRNASLAHPKGQLGFMTPFVWMFISSYEKLRDFIITNKTISSLIQLEYSGFDGATVPICTFTLENTRQPDFKGGYVRLTDFRGSENQGPKTLEAIKNQNCEWFFRASAADFKKIPNTPIAYWVSEIQKNLFTEKALENFTIFKEGITTANNDLFLRLWHEVDITKITFNAKSSDESLHWVPYNKGGPFRKWYGNQYFVVNWQQNGSKIKDYPGSSFRNPSFHFRKGATFSALSSSSLSARYSGYGFAFDSKAEPVQAKSYD